MLADAEFRGHTTDRVRVQRSVEIHRCLHDEDDAEDGPFLPRRERVAQLIVAVVLGQLLFFSGVLLVDGRWGVLVGRVFRDLWIVPRRTRLGELAVVGGKVGDGRHDGPDEERRRMSTVRLVLRGRERGRGRGVWNVEEPGRPMR